METDVNNIYCSFLSQVGDTFASPFSLGLEDGASGSLLPDDASRLARMQQSHGSYNQSSCMSSEPSSYHSSEASASNDAQIKRDKENVYGYVCTFETCRQRLVLTKIEFDNRE